LADFIAGFRQLVGFQARSQGYVSGGFENLGLSDIRGAVIIHELLHAFGKIPNGDAAILKVNNRQSKPNSEIVRENCF
jgi:hypothetical protein